MMYCSMLIIVVPYFCVYCGIYIMKGEETVKSRSHMPDSNVCYVTAPDSLDEVERSVFIYTILWVCKTREYV
jgi:hypothetical protein